MKKWLCASLILIPALFFVGCNAGVKNPPVFVEMYLDPGSVLSETAGLPQLPDGWLLLDETVTTTTTTESGPEDAGDIYSESDFEIVVVTNGPNYDLLFSVELSDSELGACVYTDQSTLYHATSTIEVQKDGSYTTLTVLTVPGSAVPETYLSERTITLSKILFTRDTVNGTFPADIPENTDTSLLFTVHAREYFDASVGLPVRVNGDGRLDVILTPESPFYATAQAAAVAVVDLPSTLNGYEIGTIWLEDLPWVTQMTLSGGQEHCFLLGDFSSLQDLTVEGFYFESLTELRHLTLTGTFSSLETLHLEDLQGYRVFLGWDGVIDSEEYDDYLAAGPQPSCDFSVLQTVETAGSHLDLLRIGRDGMGLPFPALETVSIADSVVSSVELGNETTDFSALSAFTVTDSHLGTVYASGTKQEENPGASLSFLRVTQDYTLNLSGSVYSSLLFTDSNLGGLDIGGATGEVPSRLSGITLTGSTFAGGQNQLFLHGVFPSLGSLDLSGFSAGQMVLGDIGSVFGSLTSISLSGVSGSSLMIGERDASFPALTSIALSDCVIGNIRIGGENADYPVLEEIRVADAEIAGDLIFGYQGGFFDVLNMIFVSDVTVGDELCFGPTTAMPDLATVVVRRSECVTFGLYVYGGPYELYYEDSTASVNFALPDSQYLSGIWITSDPVTSWAHYAYATGLGIPVAMGTWTPE